MSNISAGLDTVRRDLANTAIAARRDPATISLIAVSKTHDQAAVLDTLAAGQRHFGENRVQEAAAKFPDLRPRWPDLRLHLIGPLQTNKVREAVALADVIHTVDRPKLVAALVAEMARTQRRPDCLIQVNTGREPQKTGVLPEDADRFIEICRAQLPVIGLMCIPPADADPRPHFAMLREIAMRHDLPHLSMGMSGDYKVAIAEGATFVRVGTAIFGARPQP